MFFSRNPRRLSRFNARHWHYQQLFATPKSRRLTIAATLTVVALVGTLVLWPRPQATRAADRKVAWKTLGAVAGPAAKETKTATAQKPTNRTRAAVSGASPSAKAGAASPTAKASAVASVKSAKTVKSTGAVAGAPVAAGAATTRPVAGAAAAARPADPLGPVYVDDVNGFSMRFPARWSIRSFNSEPWILDCGDARVGLISIGFSTFPSGYTAASIANGTIARRIQQREGTTLHAQGYATISGRRALWNKSTGPLRMSNGSPKMTRVNYILPLNDGRVLELRVAATPETFDKLVPLMKQSVATFKLAAPTTQKSDAVATTGNK